MPLINIKLATPLPDDEKCQKIIADITDYFVDELGKKRERIVINIEGINPAHIGFGAASKKASKK